VEGAGLAEYIQSPKEEEQSWVQEEGVVVDKGARAANS